MTRVQAQTLHHAMRAQVDQQFLPCVSTVLMRGREVVDTFCYGHADKEAGIPLREDHIFRAFSNTKLITSCAVLLMWEEGRFQLDDPVERFIPALANRQVLRPGAKTIGDTEPARSLITIRQLLTHTSGLSYGVFDPGTVLFGAYNQAGVLNPGQTLEEMMDVLAPLPLSFQPGTRWEYSVATDVLSRLVEVISGERFSAFLARRIFGPLGMVDTDFYVPAAKRDRLTAFYMGVDLANPTKSGLLRADDKPYPGAYLQPVPRESGGGGLVTTLGDTARLVQSLIPGGPTLLKPETIAMMGGNQLPEGRWIQFPGFPAMVGRGFGLGSSVAVSPGSLDPAEISSELSWGGLAGTMWWINPRLNIAGVLMTQRHFGFGNPYGVIYKRKAYEAMGY